MVDDDGPLDGLRIDDLLRRVVDLGGSDLHLTSGSVPLVRINGELKRLTEYPRLFSHDIRSLLEGMCAPHHLERLERETELDLGHGVPGLGRFRVNVFQQRGSVGMVMRAIPGDLQPLDELGLPAGVGTIAEMTDGLVVVAGPSGSGRSTTVAAIVDRINRTRPVHIVTIEDPIEFLHRHQTGIVNQRSVGEDTPSFHEGLHRVVRQDADVIFVSEIPDGAALRLALAAAETGRLVITTVTAPSAAHAIDRLLDLVPLDGRPTVRAQLAASLSAVVCQQLIPRANRLGRTPCAEVLFGTATVQRLVREDRTTQFRGAVYGDPAAGMQTMDQGLAVKVAYGEITYDVAVERCQEPEDLRAILQAMQPTGAR
jgi:twitching motility protein PilT